jgi:hypothetical protein
MADTTKQSHGAGEGHETSEIRARPVFLSILGLALVIALSGVIVLAAFRYIDAWVTKDEGPAGALAVPAGQLPPAPRLQTDEPGDLAKYRAEEDQKLTTYGWVDRQNGVVHIPIERAKALLLERGLPAR